MAEMKPPDRFASTEEEVDLDEATLAAIDRGIKAADEGRVVPLEEVRRRMRSGIQNPLHGRRSSWSRGAAFLHSRRQRYGCWASWTGVV